MTPDDEFPNDLVARLRRTLHTEADAVTPGQPGDPAVRPLAGGRPRARRWRPGPWPLTAVAAAIVTLGVVLAALNWPSGGGGDRVHVDSNQPAASPPVVTPGPRPTNSGAPTTTTPTPTPPSTTPAVTRPAATVAPATAPAGFAPAAVTFVNPYHGWALGTAPCGAIRCLSVVQTLDHGRSWRSAPGPALAGITGVTAADLSIRFADPTDGWIYVNRPTAGTLLWSTHDGGRTWSPVHLPVSGPIDDLEATAEQVHVAVLVGAPGVSVETSPARTDAFTTSIVVPLNSGGPDPVAQLVAQGPSGWVLENNRTVVGGARLNDGLVWSSWTPACSGSYGDGALAASSSTYLYALCREGDLGTPTNLPKGAAVPSIWLFRSTDAGTHFQPVAALPGGSSAITTGPTATTVVVGGTDQVGRAFLDRSEDGGTSWQSVYVGSTGWQWKDLGFTTVDQGVAIAYEPSGSQLVMTYDGGRDWAPVSL